MHGLYVRRMIPEPGDPDREVPIAETFHEQIDDELTNKEEIWLRVQQMMKGSNIGIQDKKAKLFNEWERFTSTDGESIKRHVTIVHQTKDLHEVDYTQLYDFLKYNQVEYAGQNVGNHNGYNAVQNVGNQVVQNPGVQNVGNQNGLIVVSGIANQNVNQNGNGNVVEARVEGNGNGNSNNRNQVRCYNCRGMGHLARNCTVRPRRRDAAYLQTQLLIAQKEEAGIQLQAEEFNFMAAAGDRDEIEEVNENCILMANLQQASTSGTQTDKAPVYDSGGSTKNDSNVISAVSSVEQCGGTVKQNPATVEETCAYFESLYNKLAIEVEKGNSVNRKMKEANADLTTELARYKNQEKCFEINQEKYDKLERCYQKSIYQEQCLTKKINELQLSSAKTITTLNKEIANLNNQLSKEKPTVSFLQEEKKKLKKVFVSQKAKSLEELYFSNTSKASSVSKSISIPNEEFLDDTSPSVARKFLNELHKIVKDEIFPVVNLVDARVQNFKIQFLKEAAKFVQDFKSFAKEADESLAKHKALEYEIDRLLKAVVSQDIMSIVQSNSVVDTSNLQIELDRKKKLETCIIKKEKEYVVLWNNFYKKCEECKYDKILYDKAYNVMKQKIEWLQAQLGDLKGKSKDTPCVSYTPDPLSQKLEDENMALEFQVPPKVVESNDFAHPVTSNSVPITKESKVMKNDKVIALKMFRINPFKTSREDKFVPINQARASVGIKSITVSQPYVNTKKDVNSKSNGFSSTGVNITAKTRRPQPRSNTKNDRVPYASKSSCIKNKEVEVEEHPRNLLLSKNKKHMSSECNDIKLAIRNDKSKVVCAMCKQCLITSNHDVCVLNYVNDINSRMNNFNANVSNTANNKKHKLKVKKPKMVGSKERLASPNPSKPRICLRWSPTGRMFDLKGKILICLWCVDSGCSKHMTGNLKLLINFIWKFLGTVRFGNDHIAVILDLEVAFKRNTCFVRNLEGVELLKGNHTTNLYTINLHEMASASPICLIARATSTKSWLWHQRLSHVNFDTINDLAKNDLVTGLPKLKYHKEHIYPLCKQGNSKKASHPPKPVPNSKQRLHLLYMD
ncbi:retrovirus-related pol polyprotein from transposon TNT 1-94 [Tanacetum coccineum]